MKKDRLVKVTRFGNYNIAHNNIYFDCHIGEFKVLVLCADCGTKITCMCCDTLFSALYEIMLGFLCGRCILLRIYNDNGYIFPFLTETIKTHLSER